MSFAQNENYETLIAEIKRCYAEDTKLPRSLHNEAMDLYKDFLYIGGMPEVVEQFVKTGNVELARIKQEEIIQAYFNDMSKYNKATEIPKVKLMVLKII